MNDQIEQIVSTAAEAIEKTIASMTAQLPEGADKAAALDMLGEYISPESWPQLERWRSAMLAIERLLSDKPTRAI